MTRVFPFLLAALAAAAACSADSAREAGEPTVTVRDSAGIRIVESAVPDGVAPVYAELGELELEIGVVDGDPRYAFSRIVAVRTLQDGDILVAEGRAQELRVFDDSGTYLRSFGGPGEGPGEFGAISGLAAFSADTFQVWDGRNRRVSTFTVGGRLLGDVALEGDASINVRWLRYLSNGALMTVSQDYPEGGLRSEAELWQVVRRAEPGVRTDTMAVFPGDQVRMGDEQTTTLPDGRVRTVVMVYTPPVLNRVHAAVGEGHAYVGYDGTYEIERYGAAGDVDLILRVPDLNEPLQATEVDELRRARLESCDNENCESYWSDVFEMFDPPEMRPAFSELQSDVTGRLWVGDWDPLGEPPATWHVFSPDGELLGRVSVPPGLHVHEIGEDYILGVEENELEVPFVHRYALTRLR